MQPDSKKKNLERLKEALKIKFASHEDWKEESVWWINLKTKFLIEAKRHSLHSDKNESGDRQTRPL